MNKVFILIALLASGCATVDSWPGHDARPGSLAALPPAASCRMGAVPVCRNSTGPEGQALTSCRCAYVPGSLTSRDAFNPGGFRRRR